MKQTTGGQYRGSGYNVRKKDDRKQQTQQRIVDAAGHAFRSEGIAGAGVAEVMHRAGLTHGGFYAHFENKDALVAEACTRSLDDGARDLLSRAADAPRGEKTRILIRNYLSRQHRDGPADGCVMPALAGEIARESAPVRSAFTASFERYVDAVASVMADDGSDRGDDAALVLIAGMAGAMLLARAVNDEQLSVRILSATRRFYRESFGAAAPDEEPAANDTAGPARRSDDPGAAPALADAEIEGRSE